MYNKEFVLVIAIVKEVGTRSDGHSGRRGAGWERDSPENE